MQAQASLLRELEESIRVGDHDQRVTTLRRVTDLFVHRAEQYDAEQVALFDNVIIRLAAEIEKTALSELSGRLAPLNNAPPEVIGKLARDDSIEVAGPILTQSPCLSEADLVAIARAKSRDHMLAISGRETLGEAVTDALIERGDTEVTYRIAGNSGARFSEGGYAGLITKAGRDEDLAERVGKRVDIPPHLFRRLVTEATGRVRERLLATAPSDTRSKVQELLSQISEKVGASPELASRKYSAAKSYIRLLVQTGKLNARELTSFAKSGRFEEAVVGLSELGQVALDTADRLMHGDSIEPLLVLSRAKGFDWNTVRALLMIRRNCEPPSPADLDRIAQDYSALTTSTADRVLRFSQVRQSK
jgi:uncharacterized protein (DUF2336 family)